ncbi:RagB/SusD family nutrient uptake outer membrane protein [Polaribacter haliotis]|uniref:RagB/SusD family nutrient uptake outer membrane protein n=1 Tax=Polaribacter haliotis TaxID=1888915 RepID=A0A7L8AJ15_9FLAO|nr:RagB/SusD family nutrient uptake outer membrane protein [Polaribacter haliotis]QOD61964.1 RagB/SusD family nutrient uptake outer membrane protein [Polaribacter haliotis]
MKYKFIIFLACFQFLISCDSILEVNDDLADLGALNNELLFSTEENVEKVVNGVYAKYGSEFYQGGNFYQMTSANTPYFSSTGAKGLEFGQFDISPSSKNLNDTWEEIYSCIDNANNLIENLNKFAPNFPNTTRSLGQAHFLRALAYFDLVRVWNEVPLRTETANQETLFLPKSSKEKIYNQIISDLTAATSELPSEVYIIGRPLSFAANGYLAKVYMKMATESGLSKSSQEYWDLAFDNAKIVYDSKKYNLLPNYGNLFIEGNENTAESIFEIQYISTGTSTKSGQHSTIVGPQESIYNQRSSGGQLRVNRLALHDHYLDYNIGVKDNHPDSRIEPTYIQDSYDEILAPFNSRKIYPKQFSGGFAVNFIKKFAEANNTNINSDRNRIIFRYADLLLMLAEIENERNNFPESKGYIKEVLDRANTTLYAQANIDAIAGGDDLRTRIGIERAYELLGEGQEWFDLRRIKNGTVTFLENRILRRQDLMTGSDLFDKKNKTKFHNVWNPDLSFVTGVKLTKNYYFPIPTNEIIGNNKITNADQNPGY